jgi:hypothetical protein
MSIKAVQWALSVKGISHTNKLALIAIAESHNGKTGDCFPSQKYIADVIERSERSVSRMLIALEADGFFSRKHRYDSRGKRVSDRFDLHLSITSPKDLSDPFELPDTDGLPDTQMSGSDDGIADIPLPDKTPPTTRHFPSTTGHMVSCTDVPEGSTGRLVPAISGGCIDSESLSNGQHDLWLAFLQVLGSSTTGPMTAANADAYMAYFTDRKYIDRNGGKKIIILPAGDAFCRENNERIRMAA